MTTLRSDRDWLLVDSRYVVDLPEPRPFNWYWEVRRTPWDKRPSRQYYANNLHNAESPDHWFAWLTLEESIEIMVIKGTYPKNPPSKFRSRFEHLRLRGIQRRKRQVPEFKVYQQGMK